NAGFWIVQRDVINRFCELAFEFWDLATKAGCEFTEEPPLAYATHMLCGNPYLHTLRQTSDVWASDWTGCYAGRLPDGKPWEFTDYFSEQGFQVNPAIVHAMRSKEILCELGGRNLPAAAPPAATTPATRRRSAPVRPKASRSKPARAKGAHHKANSRRLRASRGVKRKSTR